MTVFEDAKKEINAALQAAFAYGKIRHLFGCEASRCIMLTTVLVYLFKAETEGRLPAEGSPFFNAYAEKLLNEQWEEQLRS